MWTTKPPLNLQKQVLKNQTDIQELETKVGGLGAPDFTTPATTSYTSPNATIDYESGNHLTLPITGGNGISIDADDEDLAIQVKIDPHTYYHYSITGVPTSSTNGTLAQAIIDALKAADMAMITFNKENYYKADNQHTTGTLVFSHTGYENGQPIIKTITITIATRAWKLTTIKVPTHMAQLAIVTQDGNYFYGPAIPALDSIDYSVYNATFPEGIPTNIIYRNGNNTIMVTDITLNSNGGIINAVEVNLTTGAVSTVSQPQDYNVDEVLTLPIPGSDSNYNN